MELNTKIRENLHIVKDVPIFYSSPLKNLQGILKGVDDIESLYDSIKPCTCGGKPEAVLTNFLGDCTFRIYCDNPQCDRYIERSLFDFDVLRGDGDLYDLAIRDWNDGLDQIDFLELSDIEAERLELKPHHLVWKDIIANNIEGNPKEGIYAILNKKRDDKFYACKWSIVFQPKEIEPLCIDSDTVDLYILFRKEYFNLNEQLEYYPEPSDIGNSYDINSYGEFVRAYRTLDEAKEGARIRCGCLGLNTDTIIANKKGSL